MQTVRKFLLPLILVLGLLLRFQGLDWDQGQHLHPDERFLTMVTEAMRVPASITTYLDPHTSLLNPTNIGYAFFVYGVWPLIITKYVALATNMNTYGGITIVGRVLSACVDAASILLVFLMIWALEKSQKTHTPIRLSPLLKYLSAYIYAVMVLPIQQAHFYTTDTFASSFVLAGIVCVLWSRLFMSNPIMRWMCVLGAGVSFGMALASKVSAVYALPLVFVLLGISSVAQSKIQWRTALSTFAIFCIFLYGTVRFANPYYFEQSSFLIPTFNAKFLHSIHELQSLNNPEGWFPPGVQWITKQKVVFPLQNIVIFGIGLPMSICAFIGMAQVIISITRLIHRITCRIVRLRYDFNMLFFFVLIGWMIAFFVYQGSQFSHTMRYFLYLYPFLALFVGMGIVHVYRRYIVRCHWHVYMFGVTLFIVGLWAYMFSAIYWRPQSRVTASYWMWETLPHGAKIAWEHWDDPLPLQVPHNLTKQFAPGIELPVFGPDTSEKWIEINDKLATADYYVLSSNRAWGSTVTVPKRYPKQKEFYEKLFADGYAQYRRVKTFASYPGLCVPFRGDLCVFEFPDQWAEEAFTVYDHPLVIIYANQRL